MALEHDSDSALARAVRAVGSQSGFGRLIGKRQSTIFEWLKEDKHLPGEHVLKVEAETGISRHELNPDVFGPAPELPVPTPAPRDLGAMEPAR